MAQESPGPNLDLSVYVALYLEQAWTRLATLRQNLTRLQDDPSDRTALREAYIAAHTLKGMSSTMNFGTLTALAQAIEDPLFQSHKKSVPLAGEQLITLLTGCDEFEAGLERLNEEDKGR
jgi:two-component system chemotaxis sensor kinase CheA